MTLSVAISTTAPAANVKAAETNGKNAEAADQRFQDAVDRKAGKRTEPDDVRASEQESRPASALERLMARFGIQSDDTGGDDGAADQNVVTESDEAQEAQEATPDDPAVDEKVAPADDVSVLPAKPALGDEIGAVALSGTDDTTLDGADATEPRQDAERARNAVSAAQDKTQVAQATTTGASPSNVSVQVSATGQAAATMGQGAALSKQQRDGNDNSAPTGRGQPSAAPQASATGSSAAVASNPDAATAEKPSGDTVRSAGPVTPPSDQPEGEARTDIRTGKGTVKASGMTANDALSGRVNVLGFSAAVAPAATSQPLLGPTASSVFEALEGDPTWRSAATDSTAATGQRGQLASAGVNSLRIQLNPAELGTVTARLTAAGEQLSVEIEVESSDARQRLSSDSESILKALRAIGYDIEKVVITQSSSNASANPQQGAGGREQFAANQQAQGEGGTAGGRDGGRGTGTSGQDGEAGRHATGDKTADRTGGSLYI